jgi:hypothetical protein
MESRRVGGGCHALLTAPLCDRKQAISPGQSGRLMKQLRLLAMGVGRKFAGHRLNL